MAHECPECGFICHCNGDIDDISFGESDECKCCFDKLYGDEDEYEDDTDCCTECGKEMDIMEHNYGTVDILVCIHCYQLAQEK